MTAELLRLLELAHPGRSQADLQRMVDDTPDRARAKPTGKPAGTRSGSRPRTGAGIERRRSWAASGWMPPQIACRLTLAEQAVMAVIAEAIFKKSAEAV